MRESTEQEINYTENTLMLAICRPLAKRLFYAYNVRLPSFSSLWRLLDIFHSLRMYDNSTRKWMWNKIVIRLNKLPDPSAWPRTLVQKNNSGLIQVRHIRCSTGSTGRCNILSPPTSTAGFPATRLVRVRYERCLYCHFETLFFIKSALNTWSCYSDLLSPQSGSSY